MVVMKAPPRRIDVDGSIFVGVCREVLCRSDVDNIGVDSTQSKWVYLTSPFQISAGIGLEEYVTWKIRHNPDILDTEIETAILFSITEWRLTQRKPSLQILESLLRHRLSPRTPICTILSNETYYTLTVWESFVLTVIGLSGNTVVKSTTRQYVGGAMGMPRGSPAVPTSNALGR
jgi:hypothetical protein